EGCLHALSARAGSLDENAQDLLVAANSGRSWPKQVRTDRGKCPLAPATHSPQTAGEKTTSYQGRSYAPRSAGKARSYLAASPLDRATRHTSQVASEALSLELATEVKGRFSQAQDRRGNDCLDPRNGDEQPTLGR